MMKAVVEVRSVFVCFLAAVLLALGVVSVAYADEVNDGSRVVDPILAAATEEEPFIIRTFDNPPTDPRNSEIELNIGRMKVRVFGTSSNNITWTSDNPNIFKVEYGTSAGLANNSECYLIPVGGTGWGNITVSDGKKSMTFKLHVVKVPLSTDKYKFASIPTCTFEGKPCTPSVVITGNIYTATSNGMQQALGQLKEGRDYKVEYKNNDKVGQATAVVTGIGNYEGTVSIPFTIKAAPAKPSTPSDSGSSGSSNAGNQSGIASDAGATTVTPQAKPTAPIVTGTWKKSGGKWWFSYDSVTKKAQNNKSWPANEWVVIQGKQYYFNSSGYMNSGWLKTGSTWYYLGSDGAMKTGWQKVKGKWYYLASDGKMQTGKKLINNKIYYLTATGAMKTGWNKESKGWFYYTGSGVMKTGWLKTGGKWYYLNPANGIMKTGFYDVGSSRYYSNGSGVMKTGWVKASGKWYYLKSSGAMAKGWSKVKGKWYYLNPSDGVMKTGFYDAKGKRYYSNGSGVMQTGWKKISSKWYYFSSSGAMQTNKWIGGKYYVGSDGVMATNQWISDKWYVNKNGLWTKTR